MELMPGTYKYFTIMELSGIILFNVLTVTMVVILDTRHAGSAPVAYWMPKVLYALASIFNCGLYLWKIRKYEMARMRVIQIVCEYVTEMKMHIRDYEKDKAIICLSAIELELKSLPERDL
jgi:hypothetical protein